MNRNSTALAAATVVLGLCPLAPAMAQSNVAIDGWLDIGLMNKTESKLSLGNIGRSNLAFSGSEDLGDGLSGTFRLSTRFDMDTGSVENANAGPAVAKPFWKDETTIGLKGAFGAVRFGRALTPLWAQAWAFDPWYNFDRIGSLQWWQFVPDFLSDPASRDYARVNNAIFYDSPDLSGFSSHLSVSVDKASTDLAHNVSASFNYKRGDLSLMLGLEENSQKDKAGFLGASYAISAFKVMGSYNFVKLNPNGVIFSDAWTNWAGASNPTTKRSSLNLAATYTEGQHTIRAGIGRDFQGSTSGFNFANSSFVNAGTGYSGPIDMASAGYVYALRKRTSLFGDVSASHWEYTDDDGRTTAFGYAVGLSQSF